MIAVPSLEFTLSAHVDQQLKLAEGQRTPEAHWVDAVSLDHTRPARGHLYQDRNLSKLCSFLVLEVCFGEPFRILVSVLKELIAKQVAVILLVSEGLELVFLPVGMAVIDFRW